jgi:hypothetical protein
MTCHIRIDRVDTHAHLTVFMNGANAGHLCMTPEEARAFIATMRLGPFNLRLSDSRPALAQPEIIS